MSVIKYTPAIIRLNPIIQKAMACLWCRSSLISSISSKRRTLSTKNFCQQIILDNCSSGVDYTDTVSGGT